MYRYITLWILLLAVGCGNHEGSETNNTAVYKSTEYVGEAACISCHSKEYNDWQGSHHDWAMKLPNDSTVLGDFNNIKFEGEKESYLFYKKDTTYYVKTGPSGNEIEYPIAYTFGVTPLQQYLIEFPNGKYQK